MKRTFAILALCGTFAVNAAIKRDPAYKPDAPPAPAEKQGDTLEELLGRQGVPFMDGLDGYFDPKVHKKLDDHFSQLLEGHQPGAAKASPATFTMRDAKKPGKTLAFATGVNAAGWALTKASEVKATGELQAEVKGAWVAAKVARIWDEHDLALVKLDATDIATVQWSATMPGVGGFITAPAPEGKKPVAIGVVSVAARSLQEKGRGFLGVGLEKDALGLKVRELIPGGAANGAGVKLGDRVLEFEGQKPDSVFTFTKLVSDRKAGEKVKLKLKRGEEVIEKEIALGDRAARARLMPPDFDRMNGMGSTISKRRGDFPNVVQTDFPIDANQCGGPVTDLDGNVVGIVIARSGRIETLIIPADTVAKTLAGVDFAKEAETLAK